MIEVSFPDDNSLVTGNPSHFTDNTSCFEGVQMMPTAGYCIEAKHKCRQWNEEADTTRFQHMITYHIRLVNNGNDMITLSHFRLRKKQGPNLFL